MKVVSSSENMAEPLESLQTLISRMVNKQVKKPVGIFLDIADYKKRRADFLRKMASRLGDNVKKTKKGVTWFPSALTTEGLSILP